MIFFLKGAILGLLIAAPIGPIGVLCIQRTLTRGMTAGFVSGIGTALADTLYCALAAFGMTVAAGFLESHQFYLNFIGGMILLYLGCRIFRSHLAKTSLMIDENNMITDFISAFFITLANPLMILSFAVIFAGTGVVITGEEYQSAILLVFGVFVGSVSAWLALSGIVSRVRTSFCLNRLQLINWVSGMIIAGVGIFSLFHAFTQ